MLIAWSDPIGGAGQVPSIGRLQIGMRCGKYRESEPDSKASGGRLKAVLCYLSKMDTREAIATIRRHESALRARGVAYAAVFGSVARGDNRPHSDLDILVEFEPGAE